MTAILIDPPITRLHWADRVQCLGKVNGWSTCGGVAWLPNDSSVRFCWCGPDCRRRADCWYFLPGAPKHMRDRGTKRYNMCSEFDVPELLRKWMESRPSWRGYRNSVKRRVKKDPRVSDELAALARGCILNDGFDPLIDFLLEQGFDWPGMQSGAIAGAIARWEWPFEEDHK